MSDDKPELMQGHHPPHGVGLEMGGGGICSRTAYSRIGWDTQLGTHGRTAYSRIARIHS